MTPLSASPGPPDPPSVREAGHDRFRRALFERRLRPGQFVSQRELVELLGLSIGALRELLPRLQAEGLLTVMPQRGIQITQIDLAMIRQAFQMRMALEREAVVAAVRGLPDAALDTQEALHRAVLADLERAPTPDLFERAQQVDDDFHQLLIDGTRNDLVARAYALNAIRIRLIRLDRITLSARVLPAAFGDHLAILDAIRARDRHAAMDAMERHIMNARERALEL